MKKLFLLVLLLSAALPSFISYARGNRPPQTASPAALVGAGDIADCTELAGAEATAKLLQEIPGTAMAIGGLAYPDSAKTWRSFLRNESLRVMS
jgi:hypothetical protein